jgi:Coenzyme PQQ synthesis protein D (PqqD)
MISSATRVVMSKDQVSCDLAGEAAILNLKNSVYYGLDPVGARIWNLIQTPTAVAAVRDAIVKEYDVEPERCERDLLDLLQKLEVEGLIEIQDETAA